MRGGALEVGERALPEETAVAFTFNGSSYAVMMATPRDLEDFAIGFSLTEGVIASTRDIESLQIIEQDVGIELRMWLRRPLRVALHRAAPLSCGPHGLRAVRDRVTRRSHAHACHRFG